MNTCHGRYGCYCSTCQADRLSTHTNKQPDALLLAIDEAKDRENEAINLTFEAVLNQVAISKAFRLQIYKLFHYKNTASYFKAIKGFTKEEAKKVADPINRACKIFDRFDDILKNLQSCPHIDIRKLSVNQLSLAFDPQWCIIYNEALREQKGGTDADFVPAYSEDDFWDFIQVVKSHPVYRSIDRSRNNNYGKKEVAALLHRAQGTILSGR